MPVYAQYQFFAICERIISAVHSRKQTSMHTKSPAETAGQVIVILVLLMRHIIAVKRFLGAIVSLLALFAEKAAGYFAHPIVISDALAALAVPRAWVCTRAVNCVFACHCNSPLPIYSSSARACFARRQGACSHIAIRTLRNTYYR